MSVSVNFYLEVRHDGKWALLRWKQPTELETYFRYKEKRKWETRAEIFSCDYRFAEEFLDKYSCEPLTPKHCRLFVQFRAPKRRITDVTL